ncbi:MAG TPA: response regulator transcription factor, partial [Bacteroidia bacterium]|nr:response regulator transcription factor [Bacteroidia bacterium]
TEEGFDVGLATTALEAAQMLNDTIYDIIILDIMLPDKNGIELCQEIRKRGLKTPILFLTALSTSENIALGLNSGGDDYLVKPFKFIELNARILALIRRAGDGGTAKSTGNIFVVADLSVNDDSKEVTRDGKVVSLTATEYKLLMTLLKNKGKVLSRVDLLESVWDINFNMGTNVVDVYINYLRKKIDTDKENKLIHTIIGMGYVLKIK